MFETQQLKLNTETFPLKADYEGEVSARVDYSISPQADTAVLYIHGYMDYFFQQHLAAYFVDQNISFYAIELRKYGSSIKAHQRENFVKDVTEYDEETSIVMNKIKSDGHTNIIINGHSTGGLIATHYAMNGECKQLISGMILNSPFLEFNTSAAMKRVLSVIAPIARFFPYLKFTKLPSLYTESLHTDYQGRWDFNLKYKPIPSFITYMGWFRAILQAQHAVRKQTLTTFPCIIFHSDQSYTKTTWDDLIHRSDAVLNVKGIATLGKKIYPHAEIIEIKNAVHDIVLSEDEVIKDYFAHISAWLKKHHHLS